MFGPVLHVVRFAAHELNDLIDDINKKGFALTHGIHSRIDGTINHIASRIEAGNVYINRNIVGAVVGVQPFGGHGMSGTGPKAGGPFYLQRLSRLNIWHTPNIDDLAQIDEQALSHTITVAKKLGITDSEIQNLNHIANHAKASSLNGATITLPGPTGERNTLSWRAPYAVTIYGGNLVQSLNVWLFWHQGR